MGAVCVFWGLTEDMMSGIDGCMDAFPSFLAGADHGHWVAFLYMGFYLSRYDLRSEMSI